MLGQKKNVGKKQRATKQSAFLINFIVHFKISEFIWEVKSSAPYVKFSKNFFSKKFFKDSFKAQISLRSSSQ